MFYLQAKKSDFVMLQENNQLMNVVVQRDNINCTTIDILKLNERAKDALNEILIISEKTLMDLLERCLNYLELFSKMSEAIGILDMLTAFSTYGAQRPSGKKS